MSKVQWTKLVTDRFIELGMLTEDEQYLLLSRIAGASITEQSLHLNCSRATVNRKIQSLKYRYDAVQAEHPDIFPPRRVSEKEKWMDSH